MTTEPYRYRCEACGSVSLKRRQGYEQAEYDMPYWKCDSCGHKSKTRLDAKEASKAEL